MADVAALTVPGMGPVAAALKQIAPSLAAALPSHMKAERMIRIALTALRKNPKLGQCDLKSFIGCIMQAAQLGLEPDGLLGEAYLIPYGQEAQLVVGYKGLLKLARQSGLISTITARAVHAHDRFVFEFGVHERLEHTPTQAAEHGELTWVYAIARMRDTGVQVDVMSRADVEKIRDKSQGYQSAKKYKKDSPWDTHFDEMAKKTVLRRLCKLLPSSIELQRAVALDEMADAGVGQGMSDALAIEGIEIPELDEAPIEGRRMPLKPRTMTIETPAPEQAPEPAPAG